MHRMRQRKNPLKSSSLDAIQKKLQILALCELNKKAKEDGEELGRLRTHLVEVNDELRAMDDLRGANEELVSCVRRAQSERDTISTELQHIKENAEVNLQTLLDQGHLTLLSRASHELRTPLNAILGFCQLMLGDDDESHFLDSEQRERVEGIKRAGQQLLALANEMLDRNTGGQPGHEIILAPVAISDVADMELNAPLTANQSTVFAKTPFHFRSECLPINESRAAHRVLYIEDNPINAMLMSQIFSSEPQWEFFVATNGAEGIALAASMRPSLILLDMNLGDMTGLHVFTTLKSVGMLPPCGCIAVSADAIPEHINRAIEIGFTDYWTKPVNITQLVEKLHWLLPCGPKSLGRSNCSA